MFRGGEKHIIHSYPVFSVVLNVAPGHAPRGFPAFTAGLPNYESSVPSPSVLGKPPNAALSHSSGTPSTSS